MPSAVVIGDQLAAASAASLAAALPGWSLTTLGGAGLTAGAAVALGSLVGAVDVLVVQLGRADAAAGTPLVQWADALSGIVRAAPLAERVVWVTASTAVPTTTGVIETFSTVGALPGGWTDPAGTEPLWWCPPTVIASDLGPALSIAAPDFGPILSLTDPGARGAAYRTLGAWAADNVECSFSWSGRRPVEATPLLHIVPTDPDYGCGTWTGWDLFAGVPGAQSVWVPGFVGHAPPDFRVGTVRVADWSPDDEPGGIPQPWVGFRLPGVNLPAVTEPGRMRLRSSGGTVTTWIDDPNYGTSAVAEIALPPALVGSTRHGFALDHNQTDYANPPGSGGYRPPNLPAALGPWWCVPIADADAARHARTLNAWVRDFPRVPLADWAAAVDADRALTTNGLDPSGSGIAWYASVVADLLIRCAR